MKPLYTSRTWTKRGILLELLLDIGGIVATIGYFYQHRTPSTMLFTLLFFFLVCIDNTLRLPKNISLLVFFTVLIAVVLLTADYLPSITPLIDFLIRYPLWLLFLYHLILSIQMLRRLKPVD